MEEEKEEGIQVTYKCMNISKQNFFIILSDVWLLYKARLMLEGGMGSPSCERCTLRDAGIIRVAQCQTSSQKRTAAQHQNTSAAQENIKLKNT